VRRSEIVPWALIGCAVVLGALVVIDRDRPTTKEQASRAGLLLRVFRQEDTTRITLERKGEKIEIVRQGDAWQLTSPRVSRTEFIAVTGLLNTLQGARSERALGQVTPSERAAFGLDAPRVKCEIAMKGVTLKLALGGPATGGGADAGAGGSAYLEVAPYGDEKGGVFVVGADVAAVLDRGADVYRDPSLVGGTLSTTLSRIAVKGSVELTRAPHGTWRLPSGLRADIDVVDGLFKTLADLKADPFVDDATPVGTGFLEASLGNGSRLELAFGGACPVHPDKLVVVQLRVPLKITGCVPKLVVERLTLPEASYLDGHALGLLYGNDTAKVAEIELLTLEAGGKKALDAERRLDGLHLRVPVDEQVDKEAADRFLVRLARIAGTVVSPAPTDLVAIGLSPVAGRLVVRRKVDPISMGPLAVPDAGGESWDQVVEIGAPVEEAKVKVVYLRRADDGAVLRVPAEAAELLRGSAIYELRNPNLLSGIDAQGITRVEVKAQTAWTLVKKDSVFQIESPPGLGADGGMAAELVKGLVSLTCLRWVDGKGDDPAYGFATPSASITLTTTPKPGVDAGAPAGPQTLEFGGPSTEGGVYAHVKGQESVCVLSEATRDLALRPPVDRSIVAFDAATAPRIVLTKGSTASRTLLFSDATKAWRDGGDAGVSADPLARKAADLLVGMRAEGLAHLGAAGKDEGFDAPLLVVEGFDAAGKRTKRLLVGAAGKLEKVPVYWVRIEGVDATYGVLREEIDKLSMTL